MSEDQNEVQNRNRSAMCIGKNHRKLEQPWEKWLDDLISVKYDELSNKEKQECIQIWKLIPPNDLHLIGKFNQICLKLLKSGMRLEKPVLSWYEQILLMCPTQESVFGIFEVLELVSINNVSYLKDNVDNILKITKNLLLNNAKSVSTVECWKQILRISKNLISIVTNAHACLIQDIICLIIRNVSSLSDKLIQSQLLVQGIEMTQCLCEKNTVWMMDQLGVILGIALGYSSYGLNDNPSCIPLTLIPSPLLKHEERTNNSKEGNKSKNRRKQKKQVIEKAKAIKSSAMDNTFFPELNWTQTSESDYSDSEIGRGALFRKSEKRVRMASLSLMLLVVRIAEKKKLAGYWNEILGGPYSLNQCLKSDYSPHCKITISAILMVLLNDGKLFIAAAQHTRVSTVPYTSWSCLLADLIASLHQTICHVLLNTSSKIVISALLRCLSVVISITPYSRLNSGLLSDINRVINVLLLHCDANIRIAALKCLKELIVLEPQTEEQLLIIKCVDAETNNCQIVQYCFCLLEDVSCPVSLKAECWSIMGYLAKHHFKETLYGYQSKRMCSLLFDDLENNNVVVQQYTLKALEHFAIPVALYGSNCGVDCLEMWLSLLQGGPLVPLLQSTSGILTAAACDCVSNISCGTFEQLPERLRICVMTILFGCVSHDDHLARAAAVRSLGIIVVFPFLSKDIQIIYDVSERVVLALNDCNLTVRIKSAWALGNLSEVLLLGRDIGIPIEEVPLVKLLEIGVKTGSDHEKVKTCSMRAIGYLLQLIDHDHLSHERVCTLVNDTIAVLVKNATTEGNMKVRWNACYSLGNMFKNNVLITSTSINWQKPTFEALSSLIVTCSNFKVRHSSCNALSTLKCRDLYGSYFLNLWNTLIEALDNAQNLPDFSEYKHQTNLIIRLCYTFCHFASLVTIDDLIELYNIVYPRKESLERYITDFGKQESSEEESIIDCALYHINEILSDLKIQNEQLYAALVIKDVLNTANSVRNNSKDNMMPYDENT